MTDYKWYVEPMDAGFTNECISDEANERPIGMIIFQRDIVCEDGNPHDLWRCPRSFIAEIKKSQHPLHFVEWVQKGNGKIRRWTAPKKKVGIKKARRLGAR